MQAARGFAGLLGLVVSQWRALVTGGDWDMWAIMGRGMDCHPLQCLKQPQKSILRSLKQLLSLTISSNPGKKSMTSCVSEKSKLIRESFFLYTSSYWLAAIINYYITYFKIGKTFSKTVLEHHIISLHSTYFLLHLASEEALTVKMYM